MTGPALKPTLRLATPDDANAIAMLYQVIYGGHYTNPLMRDTALLQEFLANPSNVWVVAEVTGAQGNVSRGWKSSAGGAIVGSVVYETDASHRLARAFGAAVFPEFRGQQILEKAMLLAQEQLTTTMGIVDVIYGTTRTSTPAPQIVTEHLGYKKLGIFPNVHKTDIYETHCLTAFFTTEALWARFQDFRLHPGIMNLYEIVRTECTLARLNPATSDDLTLDDFPEQLPLELIEAANFAKHRFQEQRDNGALQAHFYPFHSPNIVICSPCQTIEIFAFKEAADSHCTIMGIKKPKGHDFTYILERCVHLLNSIGVRYIEILVRADKAKTIERVLRARFLPCAYFPAFQLNGDKRYDFVVLSRTFEILDFKHLKLAGKNRVYLDEYVRNIQEHFLRPIHTVGGQG
ncbi:MAG: hypothetical protein RIQ81_800 [Pseudomonadota bacterium]